MHDLQDWLGRQGAMIAEAVEIRREAIIGDVTARLVAGFPQLCYDAARPDAMLFQMTTLRETPRRFHRLMRATLMFHSLAVIEREYAWGIPVMQRYNVERVHMLSQVRFYGEAVRAFVPLDLDDALAYQHLIGHVTFTINQIFDRACRVQAAPGRIVASLAVGS